MRLPFKMLTETEMEQFRADTFWTKEPETIAWIKSFADGDVFFDIGANIGVYSLFCAAIHPKSIVVAFEPHPRNYARLVRNAVENGFGDRFKCHNFMISDRYECAGFDVGSDEIGSSGGQMTPGGDQWTRSIDDLILFSFDFPVPNHIKIDIDGQELKVIHGMKQTLQSRKMKSVLVETTREDRGQIIDVFHREGFSVVNDFNFMVPHSSERRAKEGIDVENIVFTRS